MKTVEGVAAIGRDSDALETFYSEHIEAVQRFVARRVESPEDAADLTAEVFLAAIRASRDENCSMRTLPTESSPASTANAQPLRSTAP